MITVAAALVCTFHTLGGGIATLESVGTSSTSVVAYTYDRLTCDSPGNDAASETEGNWTDAGLSAGAMIPFAGWLSTIAKWGKNAKLADNAANGGDF